MFLFQTLLKNFLWVRPIRNRYLKGPPGSMLYIGNKIMVIHTTNPFLFMKTFIPLNPGFGNRFFNFLKLTKKILVDSDKSKWLHLFAIFSSNKLRWFLLSLLKKKTFSGDKLSWLKKKAVTFLRLLLAINRNDFTLSKLFLRSVEMIATFSNCW